MDRLKLLELIGDHSSRFSPSGRQLWLSLEQLIETSQPADERDDIMAAIEEKVRASHDLQPVDQVNWAVVRELFLGLHAQTMRRTDGVQIGARSSGGRLS